MINIKLSDIQTVLEEDSRYSFLLTEKFINQAAYREQLENVERALKISDISATVLNIFKESTGFFIDLPLEINESVLNEIGRDRKMIVPLYIALKKLGLDKLTETALFQENIDKNLLKLFSRVKGDLDHVEKMDIESFKEKLNSYRFSPILYKVVHGASMGARCESLLPDLLKSIEQKAFKKIPDLLQFQDVYVKYLPDNLIMRIVRTLIARLEETEKLVGDDIKELDMFSARVKEQLKNLYSDATRELRESIMGEIGSAGSQAILLRISALFTRLQRMLLGHLFHVSDYVERKKKSEMVMDDIAKLRNITPEQFRRMFPGPASLTLDIIHREMVFFLGYGTFDRDEWKAFGDNLMKGLEVHFKKAKHNAGLREGLACLENYERKGVFGGGFDFEAIHNTYIDFFSKELNSLVLTNNLFNLLEVWPPREHQRKRYKINDVANFGALVLKKADVLYPKKGEKSWVESTSLPVIARFLKNYYRAVTVLCYDIRGSSYMGARLQNAEKERKIKYKFSLEMSNIVRRYGGFLLKDTGDGGIAWFGENSKILYDRSYTESVTGKGYKLRYSIFSGGEFELLPAEDSAKRAMLCAIDMVKKAEEFIKANFVHYREWFGEFKEREVKVEGITYALLPPAFRSLFRIGVGIASGLAGRDLVFGLNSFGDPDLVGPLLSDANFLSMGKEPTRSVIIADLNSIINLVANVESFDFMPPRSDQNLTALIESVICIRNEERGYILNDLNFTIKKLGSYYLAHEKERAVSYELPPFIQIDETGNVTDQEGRNIKLIFEVIPTEMM